MNPIPIYVADAEVGGSSGRGIFASGGTNQRLSLSNDCGLHQAAMC